MLKEVDAVRYDRKMHNGKTTPFLLACEKETGEEVELIAKFSAGCEDQCGGLICEAIAAALAKDLGLPIPQPYIVNISPDFIATVGDEGHKQFLARSCPKGFGSERLPDGYSTWVAPTGKISDSLLASARSVIAFDSLFVNSDRRAENPNLMFNGSQIAVIDHEMALRQDMILFWKAPWTSGAFAPPFSLEKHLFYPMTKGSLVTDFDIFLQKLTVITDERIEEYASAIPVEWHQKKERISLAVEYIRDLRNNARPAIAELTKALS
ncbi:HipA family kinase [Comamonas sp. F1-6]|uniref:HipA family kinase n=1 Tax=Comamonas sp. F1-6 TaxID=673550 RepID=UPI0031D78FC8